MCIIFSLHSVTPMVEVADKDTYFCLNVTIFAP